MGESRKMSVAKDGKILASSSESSEEVQVITSNAEERLRDFFGDYVAALDFTKIISGTLIDIQSLSSGQRNGLAKILVHYALNGPVSPNKKTNFEYETSKPKTFGKYEMKGLITTSNTCNHCGRKGHKEETCWLKHPKKRSYNCGEIGHIRKNCQKYTSKGNNFIAATLNKNCIDCYKKTYIDTASSCHTVTSLKLLDKGTIQNVDETVRTANGDVIRLTHKGKRTIPTKQGVVTLSEVYYGPKLRYNLLSVPRMNELDTNVTFNNDKAYMNKNRNVIPLRKIDGLWALPAEEKTWRLASLRMELGGKTDAKTWHKRLGHVSNHKLEQMISAG